MNPNPIDPDQPQLPTVKIQHPPSPRHPHPPGATPTAGARRKIGVAVDLSDESAHAVRWAVHHYIRPGDAVLLLHVSPTSVLFGADWGPLPLPTHSPRADPVESEEDFDAFTASKAADLARPLREAQIPYKIHIVKDHDMKERLCLEVERLGLCAVIMGSRGFGAARRGSDGRLGSVSDYCVHHCVCPVVVVRYPDGKDGESNEPVVKVSVPIDEADEEAELEERHIKDVQPANTNPGKPTKNQSWSVKEDMALMSSWCFVSEDNIRGKNQKVASLWERVKILYDEARAENPDEIGERNVPAIKGRYKRLSENASKWVSAYQEAYGRKRSGMSLKNVEEEAHTIYKAGGSKFNDLFVFNEVMSKHLKWELKLGHDSTRFRSENEEDNEESGGSSKRTRTTEDGEYAIPSHQESPLSRSSTMSRPIGREAAKKNKGKGKVSQSFSTNEFTEEIRALRITKDIEVEVMSKLGRDRIELEYKKEQNKFELEKKRAERKTMQMNQVMLNTLLGKAHLSAEDEEMRHYLMSVVFGK